MSSKTQLYDLEKYVGGETINELNNYIVNELKWNWQIPGGQLRYFPPRKVNSVGDGSPIDSEGNLEENQGWNRTYWTASQNHSNMSLETKSEKLPDIFRKIIPTLRKLFRESYSDVTTTNYSFVIAVCNYYTDREHIISAHTDDNKWYPRESPSQGPVLASYSLYPSDQPKNVKEFAN